MLFRHSFLFFASSSLVSLSTAVSPSNSDGLAVELGARSHLQHANSFHQGFFKKNKRALGKAWTGTSTLANAGSTGVSAMQISVVDNDHILIFDKDENNTLQVNGHEAWGSIYTISSAAVRALNLKTNSFCAGGGWLSNGTMVSVGGNPNQNGYSSGNGLQAVRLFTPCTDNKCDVYENPSRIRLTSKRWYASTTRLSDGSLTIWGGMLAGGYNNVASTDNPTLEYFPPKNIAGKNGMPIYSKFLHDALNTNLFPVMFLLPSGKLFVAANRLAMIYDWKKNKETRLKRFPNGVRISYPASSASALLPLTVANAWTPEVLFCGGSTVNTDDTNPTHLSATDPASSQCVRMVLTSAGVKKGWAVEQMPTKRVLGDAILTPDGKVLIINGAGSGVAGYGNVKNEIGNSNAENPVFKPVLYDPVAAAGSRFSSNFPSSSTERLYHSSATLVPDGRIFIAGSNPNDDVTTKTYRTRYNAEFLSPPYMSLPRPTYSGLPANIQFHSANTMSITIPAGGQKVQMVIMDLGYSTHGVHMNNRWVELVSSVTDGTTLQFTGPANGNVYPPGYAWAYVLVDGVPSVGQRVMIGTGAGPPVDEAAIAYMLKHT